ncbi:MAG: hypothetical protein OXI19_14730 [Gemmatimonadota bacterium]|nr:hypothetical protein [Gemmatimonadota bacterium]
MTDSIPENVAAITRWIPQAAQSGADLVVFPEMMLTGYGIHLFDFFKTNDWYLQVEEAFGVISRVAGEVEVNVLVGSPFRNNDCYLNALVLLRGDETPVLAGGRSHIEKGIKNHWGFEEAQDRTPVELLGIAFGSVFCDESVHLDLTKGKGLENSDVILWPSVTCSWTDENRSITKDNAREGATQIARCYGMPVIHANYVSYASEKENEQSNARDRTLGGAVACDASGRILDQASWTEEDMRLFDISRIDGTVVVTPIADQRSSEFPAKTLTNE